MGKQYSADSHSGYIIIIMKLIVLSALLAVAASSPRPAADPHVLAAVPIPTHQWPAAVGPGIESTCYGCRPVALVAGRKKRDAEPHGVVAVAPAPLAVHPGHATSYVGRTIFGYPHLLHKRDADPHGVVAVAHPPVAVPIHTNHWPAAVGPGFESTCYGCRPVALVAGRKKRDAEPHGVVAVAPAPLAVHPGHATSYVGRTIFGYPHLLHKRDADPHGVVAVSHGPVIVSPALSFHPGHATSYVGRTVFGYPYGK